MIPPSAIPAASPELPAEKLKEVTSPPAPVDPAIQRKINSAQGKGFYRDAPPMAYQQSGEEITLKGPDGKEVACKYCLVFPCRGPNWEFEGQWRFKCNACGKGQLLGKTQAAADETKARIDGMDNAKRNRARAWREGDVKRDEERRQQLDNIAANPNRFSGVMKDPRFVSEKFFE